MSAHLRRLQGQIDELRSQLRFSGRGEVIYLASRNADNEIVIVEADGFGGAVTKVVEGNYPLDFFIRHEKSFSNESTAIEAAQIVVEGTMDAAEILA
ncbi:MAG: hypothetical protein ABR557_11840 [Pyrinomonadaceae bacterium]